MASFQGRSVCDSSKGVLAIPAKVIASSFALIGFIGALAVGYASGNELSAILWRAILIMLICWPIGRFIGGVATRATEENIEAYKRAHPIPGDGDVEGLPDDAGEEPPQAESAASTREGESRSAA